MNKPENEPHKIIADDIREIVTNLVNRFDESDIIKALKEIDPGLKQALYRLATGVDPVFCCGTCNQPWSSWEKAQDCCKPEPYRAFQCDECGTVRTDYELALKCCNKVKDAYKVWTL